MERIGTLRSSLVMSAATVLALLCVHLILKAIEGDPVTIDALINIPVEGFVVAAPLIFYSRASSEAGQKPRRTARSCRSA